VVASNDQIGAASDVIKIHCRVQENPPWRLHGWSNKFCSLTAADLLEFGRRWRTKQAWYSTMIALDIQTVHEMHR
jgi:hypothetical protein